MNIRIDTHTHSISSGHAYSTVDDLARGARKRGLAGFVLTDHGPSLPGGTHAYHFGNLRILPEKINGVLFFKGIEANIMDLEGAIDLGQKYIMELDFVMAGFHEICFAPRSREENTRAMAAALANPFVDAISHPGNRIYPIDIEAVVQAAADHGKALEINNATFRVRPGSEENCRAIARLCAEKGVYLCCGSDAHYWEDVGNFTKAKLLLKEAGASPDRLINSSVESFRDFIAQRRTAKEQYIKDNP
ncbi:phosphatase [Breznakiella homolactica]|uniref:Phosphatase n=1 Tax=Breznakiella homolactica TaxID=2798577 RepID=A0A7T7XRC0_9SPIR|nr:phosphatase [Breznakiella homolactica]QQO11070.1 phosphatase [Breznakiella homolactica]